MRLHLPIIKLMECSSIFPCLLLATWEIFIFRADDGIIGGTGECVYPWGWGHRDNWFIASRHVVSKQLVMFLKWLELTGAYIPLSSWVRALETPGRGKQHILFLQNKSPILLSETFCSPEDTGPAYQTFQWALLWLTPISIKMVSWDPEEETCHIKLFIFFRPSHLLQPRLDPFCFLPALLPPYPGLPQSPIITQRVSFWRCSEENNSWTGLGNKALRDSDSISITIWHCILWVKYAIK